jgi:hypothetical protein
MTTNASISTKDSTVKAKELAEKMLAKASNKSVKFPNSKASSVCPSCLGTGTRYVYHYGKRLAKRCEAAKWDAEKKRFICVGNPDAEMLERVNKKDLTCQIWKIVMFLKQKESFLLWLQQQYKTEDISCFSLQQLELILNKVQTHSIFSSNQETQSQQQPTTKAA